MKVINMTESTIYLDDIDLPVMYSRDQKPIEIDNKLAKRSKNLKWAINKKMLIDVTNGVPKIIPKPMKQEDYAAPKDPPTDSKFHRQQAMLSNADPLLPAGSTARSAKPVEASTGNAVKEYKETGKMSVVYCGPTSDLGGYANMNRKFMFGLSDMGVNVKYDPLVSMNDIDIVTGKKIKQLQSARVPADAPKIYGMTAPLHYSWDRYKMLFTMMETRRLHPDYVERCNCADEIVVPTRWCKGVFQESGVKKPVSVVPLGVDVDIYRPGLEPLGFSKKLKDFVFLSMFGWSMRKGYDVLLKAYLEEFTSDDPVSLLISSRYFGSTDESKKQVIRNDIARVSSMVSNPKKPHVILFGDLLPIDMMPRLYASADCFVLFSRGEGFSLGPVEAGACGLPVITTRYSGQTDFLDDDNSYLVDIDGFRKADRDISWISYFYENAEFPILGPSVVEQARVMMRRVYENREESKEKAGKLRNMVVSDYNWERCIGLMHDKLKRTFDKLGNENGIPPDS